jgi:peptidoglycan/LPS O-acetylase OafA/YrhL
MDRNSMTARPADQVADHVSLKPIHLQYRPDIDGLRAFAVLIVLFFHAFENELPGGFVGVDVFFVISGFLISTIIFKNLERESFSFVDFYIRRIKRILPVLILVLAACYAYGWFKMYPAEFMALGKHMAAGSIFGSNFALWQEAGYFDAESSSKPLLHLWSLAIEEQFYLLWPVLALVIFKLKLRFLPVNLLIVAGSFVTGIYLINIDQTAAFYSPASRFWEIGLGSLIAWITFKHGARYDLFAGRFRLQHMLSVFGAGLLLFSLFYFDQSLRFPGYWAVLPTLGAAMVILAGPDALINKRVLAKKPVVWVGLISYPIYLWHWPLLTAVHLEHTPFVVEHLTAIKWGVVAGSVALGWLSFTLVEKPLKKIRFEKPLAASIFVTFLGLGVLGLYTNQNDGIATRIPENVRELASITNVYTYFDFSAAIRQDTCHFTTKMPDNFTRPAECFDTKRPLIMLWGDSYAAALYPGLRELSQSRNLGIEQVTVGNAPPFFDSNKLGADTKTLSDENSYALAVAYPTS